MKNLRVHMGMLTAALLIASTPATAQFGLGKKATKAEPTRQIAYFKVRGALAETPVSMPPLFGGEPPQSLKGLLGRLKKARTDDDIVAVVVDFQDAAIGQAQLWELTEALRKFAAVDKEVYLHADSLRTGSYALATAASHVSVVPTGVVWLTGFYGEAPYLRGLLDKIGCVPDFEQCGSFKSAGESYMRTGPSPEAQKMYDWLLDDLFDNLIQLIATGRDLPPEKVRQLIDNGPYSAEEALAAGLIDSVQHRQDFVADLKARYGEDVKFVKDYGKEDLFDMPDDNFFAMFDFFMKLLNPEPTVYTNPSVAIVYVDGAIQQGTAQPSPFGGAQGAFSTTIRRALDKAAGDDSVKAVVMRVDSPGGSALASEIILDASKRVAAKKPLIVSMGNVAGSGGYYVACAAEAIFASPSTITASIGVISGKVVTTGMWDKLGVNWHANQRGKMAGMLSTASTFDTEERAKLRHYMETVYGIFKGHVLHAREEKLTKPIDELAGGRVFTGRQALKLGLVDKIGGLDDAVKYAADQAGLGEYELRVIPEPPTIFDLLMPQKDDDTVSMSSTTGLDLHTHPIVQAALPILAKTDPMRVKLILQALTRLELVHDETVIMMMPEDWVIR